jgi:MoxR-like ATPase
LLRRRPWLTTATCSRKARELTGDPHAAGDKTFGRKREVEALARLLANAKSVVLLGPHGVGKTAIVQKLLSYLSAGRLPELAGASVYEVSTTLHRHARDADSRGARTRDAFANPLHHGQVFDAAFAPR